MYQKAYLEFFCSEEKLKSLVEKCKSIPSLTFTAVNKDGKSITNIGDPSEVNAVTWGVFPGKEIIQPTVVDPDSFMVWKDEAFELWTKAWACLFPDGDLSKQLLEQVFDVCVSVFTSLQVFEMLNAYTIAGIAGSENLLLGESG